MIKNLNLLEETSKLGDLLDVTTQIEAFGDRLNSVPDQSIIALVGPFGAGKSTMLHQILLSDAGAKTWIEFEAWKYPHRSYLWEGFVLDVAEQVGESGAVIKKVEGKSSKSAVVDIATDTVSLISENLSGINFLDKFTTFFKTSPATRVFELQQILKGLIESQERDLVFVIEDIDRSGDAGVYFLETLKQFLSSIDLDKRIVVIVPIANHNYQKNIDSYLKCIDLFDFFELEDIQLDNFVSQTFKDELFIGEKRNDRYQIAWSGANRKSQTISFLEGLFKEMSSMNMRMLKLIIRKSNIVFKKLEKDGYQPDFRIVLCIEASKYFKKNDSSEETFFDEFKKNKRTGTSSIFATFLFAMIANAESLYDRKNNDGVESYELRAPHKEFKFIIREDGDVSKLPSEPWIYYSSDDDGVGYGVASFYLHS